MTDSTTQTLSCEQRLQQSEMAASGPVQTPAVPAHVVSAQKVIREAVVEFGDGLTLLCSGQDAVLVDLVLSVCPEVEVAFIDTGFHFPETIETMMSIAERYSPKLRVVVPWRHLSGAGKADFCCSDHKVEQLDVALEGKTAWFSGLRRADDPARSEAKQVDIDRRGLTKINPIVDWTDGQVAYYEKVNSVIINPLRDKGYPSIGCRPCTSRVEPGQDTRSGRWADSDKTECGIHL